MIVFGCINPDKLYPQEVSKGVYLNEPEVWSGNAGRIAGHKVRSRSFGAENGELWENP